MKARHIVVFSLPVVLVGIAAGVWAIHCATRHENGPPVADAKTTLPEPGADSVIETGDTAKILSSQPKQSPKDFEQKEPKAGVRDPKSSGDRVLTAKQLFDAPRPEKFETLAQERDLKHHKTPQEAFQAALAASDKDDWKGLYGCLTEDSREVLASFAATYGFLAKELSNPAILSDELKAALKSLNDVFQRNGLTNDHMNRFFAIQSGPSEPKSPEQSKKETREMLQPVKDRVAFAADTLAAMRQLRALKGGLLPAAELKDVTLSGDAATGIMVTKKDGKEQRFTIRFQRSTGGWQVELPVELFFPPLMPTKSGK
jgi:hypothetical protein